MYLNPRTISRIYEECRWKRGELDHMRVNVTAVTSHVHAIHHRKLTRMIPAIDSLLIRCMPKRMMRSEGCTGLPWQAFLFDKDGLPVGSESDIDKLLALASVIGSVSLSKRKVDGVIDTVVYAVIEDGEMNFRRRRRESERVQKYKHK